MAMHAEKQVFLFLRKHRKAVAFLLIAGGLVGAALTTVTFDFSRTFEGIFLLKGQGRAPWELKDDLFLGEGDRYIAGIDLGKVREFYERIRETHKLTIEKPSLDYEWNVANGSGFVRNFLPGGRQLLTSFGRFLDNDGAETSGIFIGGGLPGNVIDENSMRMNRTGMAYYDGTRWYHIWCNANEVISDAHFKSVFPSRWKYLGSRILHHNVRNLIFESSHEILLGGIPLRMDRTAIMKAGEPYVILSIRISNIGDRPATYYYLYGDEPWLGNYGTSGGNVGWAADGIYQYKGWLDTRKLHYAGLFDFGNEALGERHDHTNTANFIAWYGPVEPFVFFSNGPYDFPKINEKRQPLAGNERFIGVQWGPRTLKPGQSEEYTLAIGMARYEPSAGLPIIPTIGLINFP